MANFIKCINENGLVTLIKSLFKKCDLTYLRSNYSANITATYVFKSGPFGTPYAVSGSSINLYNGSVFTKTITANTTFTITGVPTGKTAMFTIILTNGGSATVTWPSSIKWSGGTKPTLTASGVDVLTFVTPDGGTTWYNLATNINAA